VASGTTEPISIAQAIDIFDSPYISGSDITSGQFNDGQIVMRNDADIFNALRGNCMEVKAYNNTGSTMGYVNFNNNSWGQTELWVAFDYGFEAGFTCPSSIHVLKMANNTGELSRMTCFFQICGRNSSIDPSVLMGKVDYHPAIYFYNMNTESRYLFGRTDSGFDYDGITSQGCCGAPIPGAQYAQVTPGRWHRFVMHMKVNTVGTTDATANGEVHLWQNGTLIVSKENMPWANPAHNMTIDRVGMENHFGGAGDDNRYWSAKDQSMFWDRIKVSDTAIV